MTLIKWNDPSVGFGRSNNFTPGLDSFFTNFFNRELMPREHAGFVPSVNIIENEESYCIEANAPGFDKEDFKVQVEDGVLTISAEHKTEKNHSEKGFLRKEFNYGSFKRSFNLVDLVDEENIAARYENGILKLELPKNEQEKAKKIKQIQIS
jgi:HSP20 family protein